MSDLAQFTHLALTLEPWRGQIVFVGGWAYRLYRYDARAHQPDYEALFTRDADVALGERDRLEGNIKTVLEGAGFKQKLTSEYRPPVSRYFLGDEDGGFYAEFLTPHAGRPIRPDGEPDATRAVAGVTALKLRHLEVLLQAPWTVTIPAEESGIDTAVVGLRIPNPVSFIVQKVLIREVRDKDKRAQDVLYIHDTMQLFGAMVDELVPVWRDDIGPALTHKQRRSLSEGLEEMFSGVTDTIREAASIPAVSRPQLTPQDLLALCQATLGELFA